MSVYIPFPEKTHLVYQGRQSENDNRKGERKLRAHPEYAQILKPEQPNHEEQSGKPGI
jgi:hypothetical protein